jgi:hypothetical protein
MNNVRDCKVVERFGLVASQPWRRVLVACAVIAGLLAVRPAPGADTTAVDADSSDISGSVVRPAGREVVPAAKRPFAEGERLKFSVRYGFIKAGYAYLEVDDLKEWNGRPVYALVARAESNSFFNRIYKVRNRIESLWDTSGHFSWRYAENRREGGYRAKNEIVFDYGKGEAVYHDGRSFPIPDQVQDALSSFYYTRLQPLPLGGTVTFDYHASRKSQPLEVRVLGRERVSVPAGEFDCIAIEPVLKAGGIFKNKGRLVIWLTDDERRMPVQMKSKVTVGHISVVLMEARPGA